MEYPDFCFTVQGECAGRQNMISVLPRSKVSVVLLGSDTRFANYNRHSCFTDLVLIQPPASLG